MPQKPFGAFRINERRKRASFYASPGVQLDQMVTVINASLKRWRVLHLSLTAVYVTRRKAVFLGGLIALVGWLRCPHRLFWAAWLVRSLMPQHHSHRAPGLAFAGQKQLFVTTFLEPVVRPDPAGSWACSKHVPPPSAATLIPCSHRDNSVPKVSVRQRASAKLS
jgi:hypothetical protein